MHPPQSSPTLWLTEFNTPWDACCHGIVKVLHQARTPFQEMMIVETGAYGKALVLDGCWQASTGDEFLYHEPLVHPACLIQGGPRQVLILGGGDGAALREALKWRTVEQAVLVDLDAQVIDACRRYLPEMHQGAFDDPRVQVKVEEAFSFLRRGDRRWDVIISDLTDPEEQGPSRPLFTREFFQLCRDALTPGGSFLLQAGLAGPPEMDLHVRLAATVAHVFGQMYHFISHIPTWGSPMGFVMGTDRPGAWNDPPPEKVDEILSTSLHGTLKMFDGRTMRALMNPPKYLRDAISRETRIFTLSDLPEGYNAKAEQRVQENRLRWG